MYLVCKSVPRGWGVEQLDVVVKMLDSQPRVVSSSPTLDLTVVTLSKSLYPHCSSVPSGKIGTWDSKKGKYISSNESAKNLLWSSLDFGCQHHTRGTVNVFLQVPNLAPGKNIKCTGSIASA